MNDNAAHLADLAADALDRLAADLRASRGTESDLRTLRDDRVQAEGALRRLALALPQGGDRALATRMGAAMVLLHPVAVDADVTARAAGYWREQAAP